MGFPGGTSGKELICQCRRHNRHGVWSLQWEDPLQEEMATHSSILAWEIPWTEEPGGLQSMRSQSRTRLSTHAHTHTLSYNLGTALRALLHSLPLSWWACGEQSIFICLSSRAIHSLYMLKNPVPIEAQTKYCSFSSINKWVYPLSFSVLLVQLVWMIIFFFLLQEATSDVTWFISSCFAVETHTERLNDLLTANNHRDIKAVIFTWCWLYCARTNKLKWLPQPQQRQQPTDRVLCQCFSQSLSWDLTHGSVDENGICQILGCYMLKFLNLKTGTYQVLRRQYSSF